MEGGQQPVTFAEKVKYGGGLRFDPMLEGKGGWIAGEDPKRDEEMVEAVIEVLAQTSGSSLDMYVCIHVRDKGI